MLPNLHLVLSVANRCGLKPEELPDCIQEGVLGLMRAMKFDHSRGYKFSTYAYWWIRDAVQRTKVRQRSPCHVTQVMAAKLHKIRLAKTLLWQQTGRPPTPRLTAAATGMSEQNVEGFERMRRPCFSLNRPHSEADSRELAEIVPDHREQPL